jgi:hypothetical protein
MAESYLAGQLDTRSFGTQQARLLDDLNRPDFGNIVINYLQDAMRYFQRKAFFFNNTDNTAQPTWAANTFYPQGSTITASTGGTTYTFIALQNGVGQSGGSPPVWPATVFTIPEDVTPTPYPPPAIGTAGTVVDNTVFWANAAVWTQGIWTQLATVYNINQYLPPIDYVAPTLVEVTWSQNIREQMQKISYEELRSYDVIRPSPPNSYPTMWAWYQEQIYLWPYPNGFYSLTLSYRASPPLVQGADDTNFWTTKAERLIRKYAQASIEREVLKDQEAATASMGAVAEELSVLKSQAIAQEMYAITPSSW